MISNALIAEIKLESANTKKLFERIPEDKYTWKAHKKSMDIGTTMCHIAEALVWIPGTIEQDFWDSAGEYEPAKFSTKKEILSFLDDSVEAAINSLQGVSDEALMKNWQMKSGEAVLFEMPKISVIRSMVLNHLIHHRGQLDVYARMIDVPLPAIYGPSADENPWA